jgi:hypothetical protein
MRRGIHLLVAGLVLAAGCADAPEAAAPPPGDALPALAPLTGDGVRAALVSLDGTTLVLRVESPAVALGSVQGTIRFDPADFAVIEVRQLTDGYAVANTAEAASGLLRFAAFGAQGLAGPDLFSIRIRPIRPLAQAELMVGLEVAGTVEGEPLPASRLIGTTRLYQVAP